ncbi:hypothetical protein ACP275_04G017500 [Erythranthe tilingii]
MTSYPAELLLSPLAEDLIHLSEKKKPRGRCETKSTDKTSSESSGMLVNGSLSSRNNQKVLEPKKLKPLEKVDAFSLKITNQKNNCDMDNAVSFSKKEQETDIDASGCEELVSNALKLPLLSSSQNTATKDISTVHLNALKVGVKGETFSAHREKEHLDSESAQDIGRVEQLVPKPEKLHSLEHSESNGYKGRKSLSTSEPSDPSKHLVVQKVESVSEESLKPAFDKSSSEGKRKQKVSHSKGSQGSMAKDKLMAESPLNPKIGKSFNTNCLLPKDNSHEPQKDHEKPGDRYKDFFGDVKFDDDDDELISGEMKPSGMLKDPQFVGKRSLNEDHNISKEKFNGENSEKPLLPEKYTRPASHLAPPYPNGPSSEAPAGMVPLVKEDWVSCDKCQKWRLLPLDTNPKSLPDKWLCRMLTWLPGMNRCNVPEELTTNTLRAIYHPAPSVPAIAPESQHIRLNNSDVTSAGMTSVDAISVQNVTTSAKKKQVSAKAANSTDLDGSAQSSNSQKKNLGASVIIGNLNSGNNSSSPDPTGHQHVRQSSIADEKYNDIKREKISVVNSSEKGTNLKIRTKLEADIDDSRASKRMKSEELRFGDENWASDSGRTSSKAGHGSTSLSNKDLRGEAKKSLVSDMNAEMHVPGTSDNGLLISGKCDDKESVKKRKPKEHLESGDFMEEMCESNHRKEKKARVSMSGGKDTNGSKASVDTDRKSRGKKDQNNGQYPSNTHAPDYLKSDIGAVHPSLAANSSSSKVSGSYKDKTNGQEVKGSPVESVSSSPSRFDKVTSSRKKLTGKDDFHDCGYVTAVTPRKLSGGEDGGDDRTRTVKKDAIVTVNEHVTDVCDDSLRQSNQYAGSKHSSQRSKVEEKANIDQSQSSEFHSKKSGKGYSSHSKDKGHASGSDLDKANTKASDSMHDSLDNAQLYEEKSKSRRRKSDEKSGTPINSEKLISKKDTAVGTSTENGKGQSQKKSGHDGQDAIKGQHKKHNLQQEHDNGKLPKKSNHTEVYGNGKSHSLPPLSRNQTEAVVSLQHVSGSQKENGVKGLAVDSLENGDTLKPPNQRKKAENSNGQPIRHPTPNTHKIRDVEAPSPVRRDSSSHAANNALKEAKDLKHLADRLKNSGSTESNGFYFQAALKFLHGASLLESGSSEATKHNDLMHSMHIYSSTAKLCEFCAHEYEKSKDMAAAALAYKCVEVAYMKVVYSSHANANRDRNELQTALQIVPPGESPSSSASDVDNLNHQAVSDKAALAKVVGSPQVSGNHIITSRNRSSFLRVINFAQDVSFAMEASRKSRIALTSATSRLGETSHKDGIYSLKKALDFNFQDVEGLLRLVRIAMEAINR